jgi:hypothetical protein
MFYFRRNQNSNKILSWLRHNFDASIIRCWYRNFNYLLISTKSKFRRNFILISLNFLSRKRNCDFYFNFEIGISILIWFWNRHFDSDIGFRSRHRISIPLWEFFTEINQHYYFDCLSEFRFQQSKSKSRFRLAVEIEMFDFFRWKMLWNFGQ